MEIPTVKECSTSTYAEQKMLFVSRKSFIAKKTCMELEVKGKSLTFVCRFVVLIDGPYVFVHIISVQSTWLEKWALRSTFHFKPVSLDWV